jgi:hypothetical protein
MLSRQPHSSFNLKTINGVVSWILFFISISLINRTQSCCLGTIINLVDCKWGYNMNFCQSPCQAPCISAMTGVPNQVINGVCQGTSMLGCLTCHEVVPFCETCTAGPVCLTCQSKYAFINPTKCTLCSEIFLNCETCDQNQCFTCSTGYGLFTPTTCSLCLIQFGA